MKKFELKESIKVPRILIDYTKGEIQLTGRSTINNTQEFYPRIMELFQLYVDNPKPKTKVLIDLEYYNKESATYLFEIIKMLSTLSEENKSETRIFWHFDPDDYGIIGDINKLKTELNCNITAIEYELA
ncbi:MAG: SiaC family regulatory phosphoprotein [Flavobacteriales bacterium]|nr:SiaC family regulatory phosphoprotein [Flavobacteriales bacterium]